VRTVSGSCANRAAAICADLRRKRIRPLHGETRLSDLRGIRRGNAGELRSHVIDDVEVAVGAVVISQAHIGADGLGIRRVHLYETGEGQEATERIVSLQARENDGEIAVGQRQSESIPGRRCGNGELRCGAVVHPYPEFIKVPP